MIENNIKYKRQYKFDNCKNKYKLRFDFYLPDYNIAIEYDGKQHYDAGEYGVKSGAGFYDYSGDKAQQATKERDEKFLKLYHALYE